MFTPSPPRPTPRPNPAPTPLSLSPSGFSPEPKRPRLPAIIGALVAVALGAGVVVWLTRSGDDDPTEADDPSSASDTTEAPDTTVGPTPTTAATPATPATEVPLTLPDTVPVTTAPPEPATSLPLADPPPVGAVAFTSPDGWSISTDPAWQLAPDTTAWFTGTGSAEFQDNVNVVVESLPTPQTLDEYVAAAIGQISAQAADLEIIEQRRVVGADGVEMEVIGWTGSFAGLPRLAFVQIVTVTPTRAYIATFTSQPDRMPALAPGITPFLTSIRGT